MEGKCAHICQNILIYAANPNGKVHVNEHVENDNHFPFPAFYFPLTPVSAVRPFRPSNREIKKGCRRVLTAQSKLFSR